MVWLRALRKVLGRESEDEMLAKVTKFIDRVTVVSSWAGYALMFFLMILGGVIVVSRLVSMPLLGGINLSAYMLVAMSYIVLPYIQLKRGHLSVELLLSRVKRKTARRLILVQLIISAAITLVVTYIVWGYADESWSALERMDGEPFYPLYPAKILIAVGFSLLVLQFISEFRKHFTNT